MRFIYFENDSNLIHIFFLKNIFFSKKISRILYLISFFRIIHDKILLKIIGKISKWIKRINLLSKL